MNDNIDKELTEEAASKFLRSRDFRLGLTELACGAGSLAVAIWAWVHFNFWAGLACFACSMLGAKGSDAMAEYGRRQGLLPWH